MVKIAIWCLGIRTRLVFLIILYTGKGKTLIVVAISWGNVSMLLIACGNKTVPSSLTQFVKLKAICSGGASFPTKSASKPARHKALSVPKPTTPIFFRKYWVLGQKNIEHPAHSKKTTNQRVHPEVDTAMEGNQLMIVRKQYA